MKLADLLDTWRRPSQSPPMAQSITLADAGSSMPPDQMGGGIPAYRTDPRVLGKGGAAARTASMMKLYAQWQQLVSSGDTDLQFEDWMAQQDNLARDQAPR